MDEDDDMSLATMHDDEKYDDGEDGISINGETNEEFPEDLTSLLDASSGGSDVLFGNSERYERPNVKCMLFLLCGVIYGAIIKYSMLLYILYYYIVVLSNCIGIFYLFRIILMIF